MNGIGNKPGWAWIFILEGLFTFAFGVVSYWLLPRSPANARFLRQEEKDYIAARLQEDGATSKDEAADAFSWREVGMAFTLPQVWLIAIAFFFAGMCLLRGITIHLFHQASTHRNRAICSCLVSASPVKMSDRLDIFHQVSRHRLSRVWAIPQHVPN